MVPKLQYTVQRYSEPVCNAALPLRDRPVLALHESASRRHRNHTDHRHPAIWTNFTLLWHLITGIISGPSMMAAKLQGADSLAESIQEKWTFSFFGSDNCWKNAISSVGRAAGETVMKVSSSPPPSSIAPPRGRLQRNWSLNSY